MEDLKREEIIELYDIYGSLLTEKQRTYFEDYYYMDLSLAEIAENYNISRNAIHDQLKRVNEALINFESNLHLKAKIKKIKELEINEKTKDTILNILWEE